MSPDNMQSLIGSAITFVEDAKVADLARVGYCNPNGSKFGGTRRDTAPAFNRAANNAKRKAERNRKRDQRRARR